MKFLKLVSVLFFFLSTSSAWALTADQVVDRESLKEFVPKAAAHLEADYDQALKDFNEEGDWKSGDIYLYILDFQGHSVFHAFMPELQGENLINLTDSNGVKIVRELIRVASSAEKGGYVEYIWSNPILEGGSSSKVGYAQRFIGPNGEDLIVGSGLYLLENILCPDPDQYLNPVCGGQKTYSNICEMYKDQATFSHYGLCRRGADSEVLATYTSLKTHLYEKSCTMCHNQDFKNKKMPPLDTYDDAKAFAELSLKYIEIGLMPKMNPNFRVPPEIPTDEVVEKLREWIALDYPL